jgi:hypothetical protein
LVTIPRPLAREIFSSAGGTALAYSIEMNRWVGPVAVVIGGLLFLLPRASEAPSAQQVSDKPAAQTDVKESLEPPAEVAPSVRIEHRLIQIVPLPTPTLRARPVVPAVNRVTDSRKPESNHLVARARRALVGDGRYRPEPFPRPGLR